MFIKFGLAGFIGLALTACSTHNPVPLSGAAPVANNKEVKSSIETVQKNIGNGNVVLIRRYAQPTAYPISIKIDSKKVASLKQRKYTAINLPEGEHDVVAKWPFIATQLPMKFTIDVTGEGTQYFEFLGEVIGGFDGYQDTIESYVGARELDPEIGAEYLSKCCVYTQPKD